MSGRIRTIKPEFFLDADLAALHALDRLAFIGLWTQADRDGRLEDRPDRLALQILPYSDREGRFNERLDRLATAGFIQRYASDGRRLIQITNFGRHQRPHHTERPSEFPSPNGGVTVAQPLIDGEHPPGREGKGREGKGRNTVHALNRRERTESFEEFWNLYPRFRRSAKEKAFGSWEKLSPVDRQEVLANLTKFAALWNLAKPERFCFCPMPTTFLNQRRDRDDLTAVARMVAGDDPGAFAALSTRMSAVQRDAEADAVRAAMKDTT